MKKGPWQVLKSIGKGGMGEVYLVLDPEGKKVAIKTLGVGMAPTLFEEEVKLLIRLRQPALASVFGYRVKSEEIFQEEKGPCFWMEYIEGEDLLSAARKEKPAQIFEWLKEALQALEYLHSQSVLHGDLSPRNILINSEGRVKILDFGLATAEGVHLNPAAGTVPYMAPERLGGLAS